ncbi:MAG: energy-coupling factor transporter transmembrane component T [Anaerolineales bacterium]|jgi:energy-coupling factor transport system permease protein
MALFVYTQRSTLLHRLHPASKAVWVIAMGIILSIYFDPLPLLVLFLINLPFFLLGKLPWRSWSKPFGYVVLLGLIGYFITSLWLARPGVFTRYPGLVGVSLWQIAGEHFFLGPMAVTIGGLMYTAGQTLRSITMVLMIAVFMYSTRPNDLVYLLSKAHLPAKLVFIVMVAYRFFPYIFKKLSTVIAAQRLRGWELTFGNPVNMARQFLPVTIPVLTETVRLSDYTTRAVESRAYGTSRFTLHHQLKMTRADWIFSLFWILVMGAFLGLYIGFGVGPL